MADLELLIQQQEDTIYSMKRLVPNLKKLGKPNFTEGHVQSRISMLKDWMEDMRQRHSLIQINTDAVSRKNLPYFSQSQYEQATDQCADDMGYLLDLLHVYKPPSPASETGTLPAKPSVKLPAMELPKFDGSYRQWESFRDRFSALIIRNPRLTDSDRLQYLTSTLTGTALDSIKHLDITEANFKTAWSILTARFENTRRLVFNHLRDLMAIPVAKVKSVQSIRSLRDNVSTLREALRRLGENVDAWGTVMVFVISERLDWNSREAWEETISNTTTVPPYAQLDEFLQGRIRVLESMYPLEDTTTTAKPNNRKFSNLTLHAATAGPSPCFVCKQEQHSVRDCPVFAEHSVEQRIQLITQEKRCFNCLSPSHSRKDCPSLNRCRTCHNKHHTLIHQDVDTTLSSHTAVLSLNASPQSQPCPSRVLLATAIVKVFSPCGRSTVIRALLDQGSEATFISNNLAQLLRLHRTKQHVCVQGIGSAPSISQNSSRIGIGPVSAASPTTFTTALILKTLSRFKPQPLILHPAWSHLNGLLLADTCLDRTSPIDLLIGADLYGSILRPGLRQGSRDQPVAQNSLFGWIVSGPVSSHVHARVVTTHVTTLSALDSDLRRFWELEEIAVQLPLSPQDRRCDEHFATTHSRGADGRYIVRLPFESPPPASFGDTRSSALALLKHQERRLQRDQAKASAYQQFLAEYESLTHMSLVPSSIPSPSSVYYIPHHAVFRHDNGAPKIRVVFNASHVPPHGSSLNQYLSVGPKLQLDLPAIITRWRQHQYVCSADISKMYRQIRIDMRDVDYQRILWRTHPSHPVAEYHLQTVTYGTTSAPYLALRVLKQLVHDDGQAFPLASFVLQHQTYVDDCLFGAHSSGSAIETRDQLISLLGRGGFVLHKWASSHADLIESVTSSDTHTAEHPIRSDIDHKILGLAWGTAGDHFRFHFTSITDTPSTKRTVLSAIARLFDPLGWLAPAIVAAKILIQQLWISQCEWDSPLPDVHMKRWLALWRSFPDVQFISIPRWTGYTPGHLVELHGFADASSTAYAAAVYLRLLSPNGSIQVSLMASKSRVAPVKIISVPRLELCAALLLARLITSIKDALLIPLASLTCWSDSRVVLAWIAEPPARWTTFVANRVSKIQELGEAVNWRHVPTHSNPADCASRGITVTELRSHPLWWHGPAWLQSTEDHWPALQPLGSDAESLCERRPVLTASCSILPSWDLQHRYHSWPKLLRITALLMRFIFNTRHKLKTDANHYIHLKSAYRFWIRSIQLQLFPSDLIHLSSHEQVEKRSPLASLAPFLDDHGIMRARGRLRYADLPPSSKHPIILKTHPSVKLIIHHTHLLLLHGNPQLVLAHLRLEYWILRPRPLIRSVIHSCVPCVRASASLASQFMGDLPRCRVTPADRAFTHTGVDYAGPISTLISPGRGHRTRKSYVAVFICMTTRAVHLEVVSDCTTDTFLSSFHRFTSRRGTPTHVYSDNGTNFHGASRQLQIPPLTPSEQSSIQSRCADHGVQWHFMPPAAPHFGGLWEAAVRSLKYHVKRCIGKHTLTFEELSTLLCKVEGCLNSRPLTPLSDDLDDYEYLTPGHFLIGSAITAPPEPSVLHLSENRLSRWQLVQRLHEAIWSAWQRDYIHTLQQRPKWRERQALTRCGEMVLIQDPGLPPSHWALGRIVECHPGEDGLVRVVTIKTSSSTLKRPITKVCFLPIPITKTSEGTSRSAESSTAGGVTDSP